MMKRTLYLFVVRVAACLAVATGSFHLLSGAVIRAQTQQKTESRYTDSGKLPWVVVKSLLRQINDPGTIVADFATEEEARKAKSDLDNSLSGGAEFKWIYDVKKREDLHKKSSKIPVDPPAKQNPDPGSPPSGPKGPLPKAPAKYTVKVYKFVDGKFVEQSDKRLDTNDYKEASELYNTYRYMEGWMATWIGGPKPEKPDNGPYNLPSAEGSGNYISPIRAAFCHARYGCRSTFRRRKTVLASDGRGS